MTMTDTLGLSNNTNINYKINENVNNITYGIKWHHIIIY
jgi:hypothetical protein